MVHGSYIVDHGGYIMDHGGYIVDQGGYIVDHGGYIVDGSSYICSGVCTRDAYASEEKKKQSCQSPAVLLCLIQHHQDIFDTQSGPSPIPVPTHQLLSSL